MDRFLCIGILLPSINMPGYRNASDEVSGKLREDCYKRTGLWLCVGKNEAPENNEDISISFKSRSLSLGRSFRDKEGYLIRASRRYTPAITRNISTEIDHEDD
jgi:hypothetical protein